jgi:hypothetical protein
MVKKGKIEFSVYVQKSIQEIFTCISKREGSNLDQHKLKHKLSPYLWERLCSPCLSNIEQDV